MLTAPRPGGTVWLTGLPAAGKSTLASAVAAELSRLGHQVTVFDGDELRGCVCSDLGFTRDGRAEMARRVAEMAADRAHSGWIAIVSLISPYAADRRMARELHRGLGVPFAEVFLDTPLDLCRRRDPKGLYARAARGELRELTGIDAPYEPPSAAELRLPVQALDLSVEATVDMLRRHGMFGALGTAARR